MRTCAVTVGLFLLAFMPGLAQSVQHATSGTPARQQTAVPSSSSSPGQPKVNPTKEADIRRLLELTGVKGLATQMMSEMMDTIKPVLANSLPPGDYREKLIDLFIAKFRSKVDAGHLVELAIPIYDKHFSDDEIKGLIQFYQTPLGQKTIHELPAVVTEMQLEGKQWGEAVGRDSMREVLTEHPELAKALEAASKPSQQ